MNKLTISIFENKVFLEILKENRLFREAQISFFENYDEESINKVNKNSVVVFFIDEKNIENLAKLKIAIFHY